MLSLDFCALHLNFTDQVVFLGVFLQLVANCADDAFNLVLEEGLQRVDRDGPLLVVHLLKLLLVVQDGHHVRVVLSELFIALSVVQIYQHVCQVLVQSILNILRVLMSIASLLLLRVVALGVLSILLLA